MQKFIYALRSLTPVVVMNDEADLADAQRDAPKGDSGVSERLMKMWMEFLSDPRIRGKVVVISCTNRPDRIDPALKRSGRGDQRILIPMPSLDELPDIFRVMFKRYDIPTNIKEFMPFAKKTDGLSGADVEAVVLTAFRFSSGKVVDDSSLNRAIDDFIPSASQSAIDYMTMVGLLECSSKLLLPPNIKKIVQGIAERKLIENLDYFLAQVKARKIIDS
jgi:SpoVK/Ycf46/Vps4 family AAA+-type ATPase